MHHIVNTEDFIDTSYMTSELALLIEYKRFDIMINLVEGSFYEAFVFDPASPEKLCDRLQATWLVDCISACYQHINFVIEEDRVLRRILNL
ncbi:hypothetical protein [Microcoleus sp. B9-D4]|uniref:hypothetical protein n=1 Tax=Microcoleus sp. B9-D4 TaxID=2818711 RepID=UPI002FD0DFF0